MRDRLACASKELSQSSNHIAALEEAIEAERTSHIQTKFSCELFQVSRVTIFVSSISSPHGYSLMIVRILACVNKVMVSLEYVYLSF